MKRRMNEEKEPWLSRVVYLQQLATSLERNFTVCEVLFDEAVF